MAPLDDLDDAPLDSRPSLDPLIGAELGGRYVIGRRIARGGMGAIYEGTHLELGRKVAVKVLSSAYAGDAEAVRRFQREARASSRLDHPNIVAVLDIGRLESGEPYLVMELLEGEDLSRRIAREAPLPARVAVELLEPIARALDAVHAEGLLHRDIKPGNVFLAHRGGEITPKLLDFGLAALREAPEHDRLTREGIVVGTPHYVSPEAAEGKPLDARADVYSLAVVAYELVSGVLPFDGDRPMSLLYAKVRRPAPTLGERTERRFDPVLEQVLARSLSRTPSRRPESAGELVRLLREAAEQIPDDATSVDLPRTAERAAAMAGTEVLDRSERSERFTFSLPLRGPSERWYFAGACALLLAALAGGAAWLTDEGGAEAARSPDPREVTSGPVVADVDLGPATAVDPATIAAEIPAGVEAPPPAEPPAPAPAGPAPRRRRPRPRDEAAPVADAPAPSTAAEPGAPPPATEERDLGAADALARRAGAALLRGQYPRARTLYRQATYADSAHPPAWRGLGLANERMGLAPEAVEAYRRYLRLAPSAPDADRVRARVARLAEVAR